MNPNDFVTQQDWNAAISALISAFEELKFLEKHTSIRLKKHGDYIDISKIVIDEVKSAIALSKRKVVK